TNVPSVTRAVQAFSPAGRNAPGASASLRPWVAESVMSQAAPSSRPSISRRKRAVSPRATRARSAVQRHDHTRAGHVLVKDPAESVTAVGPAWSGATWARKTARHAE